MLFWLPFSCCCPADLSLHLNPEMNIFYSSSPCLFPSLISQLPPPSSSDCVATATVLQHYRLLLVLAIHYFPIFHVLQPVASQLTGINLEFMFPLSWQRIFQNGFDSYLQNYSQKYRLKVISQKLLKYFEDVNKGTFMSFFFCASWTSKNGQ